VPRIRVFNKIDYLQDADAQAESIAELQASYPGCIVVSAQRDEDIKKLHQREQGEWILHTLMVEGCDVPFKFKRKGKYLSLKGARVNITFYPEQQVVAGITFEVMNVVRITRG
jgi:50S ribosomal subunit-associated GTPase HflX